MTGRSLIADCVLCSATLRRLLVDRFELVTESIQLGAIMGALPKVLCFYMGGDPTPLTPFRAFMQNYISSMRGVTVIYPLASIRLHELAAIGIISRYGQ